MEYLVDTLKGLIDPILDNLEAQRESLFKMDKKIDLLSHQFNNMLAATDTLEDSVLKATDSSSLCRFSYEKGLGRLDKILRSQSEIVENLDSKLDESKQSIVYNARLIEKLDARIPFLKNNDLLDVAIADTNAALLKLSTVVKEGHDLNISSFLSITNQIANLRGNYNPSKDYLPHATQKASDPADDQAYTDCATPSTPVYTNNVSIFDEMSDLYGITVPANKITPPLTITEPSTVESTTSNAFNENCTPLKSHPNVTVRRRNHLTYPADDHANTNHATPSIPVHTTLATIESAIGSTPNVNCTSLETHPNVTIRRGNHHMTHQVTKKLFVSRLHPRTSSADVLSRIERFLKYKNRIFCSNLIDCQKITSNRNRVASFKITVPAEAFNFLNSPCAWPSGTFTQEFVNKRRSKPRINNPTNICAFPPKNLVVWPFTIKM